MERSHILVKIHFAVAKHKKNGFVLLQIAIKCFNVHPLVPLSWCQKALMLMCLLQHWRSTIEKCQAAQSRGSGCISSRLPWNKSTTTEALNAHTGQQLPSTPQQWKTLLTPYRACGLHTWRLDFWAAAAPPAAPPDLLSHSTPSWNKRPKRKSSSMSYLAFPGLRGLARFFQRCALPSPSHVLCLQGWSQRSLCCAGTSFVFSFAAVNTHIVARNTIFCILWMCNYRPLDFLCCPLSAEIGQNVICSSNLRELFSGDGTSWKQIVLPFFSFRYCLFFTSSNSKSHAAILGELASPGCLLWIFDWCKAALGRNGLRRQIRQLLFALSTQRFTKM